MIWYRTLASLTMFMVAAFIVCTAQNLQTGVSVNLPAVNNATAVPEADKDDALIVTVAADGVAFLGTEPVSISQLRDKLSGTRLLSMRKVYIKADARTRYADVEKVLISVEAAGAKNPILLVAQREVPQPGIVVPPRGFTVAVSLPSTSSQPIVLQLLSSGQPSPTLLLNDQRVSWIELPSSVERVLHSRGTKAVELRADGVLAFSDVVRAIDLSRSVGADVVLIPQA